MTQDQLTAAMQSANMRLTPQKKAIYDMLMEFHGHPTAEELYLRVKKLFPTMSLATVYDNLRKFVSIGICSEVRDNNGAARFDGNMHAHHHVLDRKTGELRDVYLSTTEHIPLPTDLDPASIKEIRITYIT